MPLSSGGGAETSEQHQRPGLGTCACRGSGMTPTVGFLGVERVLQRICGVRGQDDASET